MKSPKLLALLAAWSVLGTACTIYKKEVEVRGVALPPTTTTTIEETRVVHPSRTTTTTVEKETRVKSY